MKEKWRKIPGFTRYKVSDLGNIESISYKGTSVSKQLTPGFDKDGYKKISIYNTSGVRKTLRINRLVLMAFCPRKNCKLQAAHLNGVRSDNKLSNLSWATSRENHAHKFIHGTTNKGESNTHSKLTESDVRKIRKLYAEDKKNGPQLAKMFGIAHTGIYSIISRKNWSHVK